VTATGSMPHLQGLTPVQALLGHIHCSCGSGVELVDEGPGPATYQCTSIRAQEKGDDDRT
jgi:hypothetical protein